MNLGQLARRAEKFVADNSPTILTTIGVTGTVATAVLTGKASFKAAEVFEAVKNHEDVDPERWEATDARTKASLVWKLYIPPAAVGTITVTAIIFANRIGTRRAAAIAAAYSVTERAFEEYREKVVERVGELKEQKIRDDVAQDKVNQNPVSGTTVFVANGDSLCLESYTGRYFMSDHESIRRAENDLKEKVLDEGYASLGDLYYELKLPRTSNCEDFGWNTDKMPKLDISATVAEDGRPCLVMSYNVAPIRDYHRFH